MAKNFGAPSKNIEDKRAKGDRLDKTQRSTLLQGTLSTTRSREDISQLQSDRVNRISKGSKKEVGLDDVIMEIMQRKPKRK